jgi:hypothetical protein
VSPRAGRLRRRSIGRSPPPSSPAPLPCRRRRGLPKVRAALRDGGGETSRSFRSGFRAGKLHEEAPSAGPSAAAQSSKPGGPVGGSDHLGRICEVRRCIGLGGVGLCGDRCGRRERRTTPSVGAAKEGHVRHGFAPPWLAVCGLWSSFACYLDDNFGNETDARSLVAGVERPPRTREEESNGGCGEAPARCGCSDSVFSLRRMVLLCCSSTVREESCIAVALLVWWCLPLLLIYRHMITPEIC